MDPSSSSRTTIARVRVHGARADALALRGCIEPALAGLEPRLPAHWPPTAIACVRRLQDPLPGRWRTDRWPAAARAALESLLARAARPARAPVPASAEAVVFFDRPEQLTCLARDLVAGATDRWWWHLQLRRQPARDHLIGAWLEAPEDLPPTFELLGRTGHLPCVVAALDPLPATSLLARVAVRHGLSDGLVRRVAGRLTAEGPDALTPPELSAFAPSSRLLVALALTLRRSPDALRLLASSEDRHLADAGSAGAELANERAGFDDARRAGPRGADLEGADLEGAGPEAPRERWRGALRRVPRYAGPAMPLAPRGGEGRAATKADPVYAPEAWGPPLRPTPGPLAGPAENIARPAHRPHDEPAALAPWPDVPRTELGARDRDAPPTEVGPTHDHADADRDASSHDLTRRSDDLTDADSYDLADARRDESSHDLTDAHRGTAAHAVIRAGHSAPSRLPGTDHSTSPPDLPGTDHRLGDASHDASSTHPDTDPLVPSHDLTGPVHDASARNLAGPHHTDRDGSAGDLAGAGDNADDLSDRDAASLSLSAPDSSPGDRAADRAAPSAAASSRDPEGPVRRPSSASAREALDRPTPGSRRPPGDVATPFPEFLVLDTDLGGVFYLVNVALALGLYPDFTAPLRPGMGLPLWDLLTLLARALLAPDLVPEDPLWPLLARLTGRPVDRPVSGDLSPEFVSPDPRGSDRRPVSGDLSPELTVPHDPGVRARLAELGLGDAPPHDLTAARSDWLTPLATHVRARLARAMPSVPPSDLAGLVLRHRARVHLASVRIDLTFSLAAHPIELRLAGLDRDPGWLPSAGRSLYFHFT